MAEKIISKKTIEDNKIDFAKIEKKWQDRWEKSKCFEVKADKRKKFFINFPYPYINAYLHLGHAFSSVRVDLMARFKRMNGFNTLFPQGWHCTGTPVWAASQRIKENEPQQLKIMKSMGFSEKEIKKFSEVKHWADVFVPAAQIDFTRIGNSVDWRRSFITTDLNPRYDKFIRWQFRKLKEKNLVVTGEHSVVWCPKDNMPIGDHDRVEGEGETTQDFIWIKFRMRDSDLVLMAGTTRPDALYGQTNLWIDPNGKYVVVKVKNEKWVVGKEAVQKIRDQYDASIKVLEDIAPAKLIGQWAKGPLMKNEVHILPAYFIKSNVGSGIVYSALEDPVDLYELKKIQSDKSYIKKFKLDEKEVMRLKPIHIIRVSGLGDNLGESIGKEFGVKNSDDKEPLEQAKSELNKRVFRKGIMRENCGICAGKSVQEAQEILKEKLTKDNDAVMFYELSGRVVCRCLTPAIAKVVSDQWYLKYSDKQWKKLTHKALDNLKLYPEVIRQQFNYVLDWLKDWACTHHHGTGTRLPWDDKWVIESLSDSTIYMAYYTIAHLIKDYPEEKINDEFFDFIFLGKGKGDKKMQEMKKEFEYWYPFDIRSTAKDLVQNHMSFCLFNHTAIFPEKYWPKGFGVNGWLLVNGDKMSKSKGNFFTIREILEKYPADVVRASLILGGEGMDDPNFDFTNAESLTKKLQNFYEFAVRAYKKSEKKNVTEEDRKFISQYNSYLRQGIEAMENMLFRTAFVNLFYQMQKILRENSGKISKSVLNEFIENQIKILCPFCPHIAEELWEKLGNKSFISLEKWPEVQETREKKEKSDINEKIIDYAREIIEKVEKKQKIKKVYLYVMPFELGKLKAEKIAKELGKPTKIYAVNDKSKIDPKNMAGRARPGMPAVYLE